MRIDRAVERSKRRAQGWRYLRGETEVEGLESRPDDAGVDFGEEQSHASAVGREDIAFLAIEPCDETLASQPAEVIAHLVCRVRGAK